MDDRDREYFDLKFENIENKITNIECDINAIDESIKIINENHIERDLASFKAVQTWILPIITAIIAALAGHF